MKFSQVDPLFMSMVTHHPKKLGRLCGVDMAWEFGILNQKPHLEFPEAQREYINDINKFLKEDNELYQQFNKYQNLISEAFGDDYKPKKFEGIVINFLRIVRYIKYVYVNKCHSEFLLSVIA